MNMTLINYCTNPLSQLVNFVVQRFHKFQNNFPQWPQKFVSGTSFPIVDMESFAILDMKIKNVKKAIAMQASAIYDTHASAGISCKENIVLLVNFAPLSITSRTKSARNSLEILRRKLRNLRPFWSPKMMKFINWCKQLMP